MTNGMIRSLVVAGASSMLLVALLAETGCSAGSNFGGADASTEGGRHLGCPASPPTSGTTCALAEGTVCNQYPTPNCYCCGATSSFTCTGGKWLGAGSGGPPTLVPECPATVPVQGSPCPMSCGGSGGGTSCTYDCATGNGANRRATCSGGSWNVLSLATSCGLPDAGVEIDAGADAADAADAGDAGEGG